TSQSDAEILAFFARAAGTRTCGRFAAGQLERPLQRAVPVAPTRWRAWLAAAVALWSLREVAPTVAQAQAPAEWRARYGGGPVPATPPAPQPAAHAVPEAALPLVLRGVVTDFANKEGLPGVTVLLKGTTIGTSTNQDGTFELVVPTEMAAQASLPVAVSSIGYVTQLHSVATAAVASPLAFQLQADRMEFVGGIVMGAMVMPRVLPPAPWHPRRFYNWGKYWVMRPFRSR
ncbi:carboxypeptidase-like regulatory domain-containing protein, partial [Hymenobacter sp. BT770]